MNNNGGPFRHQSKQPDPSRCTRTRPLLSVVFTVLSRQEALPAFRRRQRVEKPYLMVSSRGKSVMISHPVSVMMTVSENPTPYSPGIRIAGGI